MQGVPGSLGPLFCWLEVLSARVIRIQEYISIPPLIFALCTERDFKRSILGHQQLTMVTQTVCGYSSSMWKQQPLKSLTALMSRGGKQTEL